MSSSDYRDTLYVAYTRDGITGHGEGAPIVRYNEDAEGAQKAVESVRGLLLAADPWQFAKVMAAGVRPRGRRMGGQSRHRYRADGLGGAEAGRAALSLLRPRSARYARDHVLHRHRQSRDDRQKVREAADFPVLKIKVGLDTDEATIEAVRSRDREALRVDANEGWKDKEVAVRKINWLAEQGVEFIEQPMPADMLDEMHWVHSRVHVPLIADEACRHASDIPKLLGAFDGVNVKLDKAGGILEAYRMIQVAKARWV